MELTLNNSTSNVTLLLQMFAGSLTVDRNLCWLHRAPQIDRFHGKQHRIPSAYLTSDSSRILDVLSPMTKISAFSWRGR